jgi:hypothetical protein
MSLLLRVAWLSAWWLAIPGWAQAQVGVAPDTVVGRRLVPRLSHNRFVAQYDSRYSIINHHLTTINGLKLGLEFKSRFRTGAAIYFLSTGVPTRQAKPDNAAEDADAQLRFRYLAAYAGYVLLEKPRWELSANLQMGLGSVYVLYEADDGDLDKTPRDFLGVAEPAFAAQYRLLHWAGFGTGVGWRQPLFVPRSVQKELNGPVFYLRANVFLGELFKAMKEKEPIFSQEGLRRE